MESSTLFNKIPLLRKIQQRNNNNQYESLFPDINSVEESNSFPEDDQNYSESGSSRRSRRSSRLNSRRLRVERRKMRSNPQYQHQHQQRHSSSNSNSNSSSSSSTISKKSLNETEKLRLENDKLKQRLNAANNAIRDLEYVCKKNHRKNIHRSNITTKSNAHTSTNSGSHKGNSNHSNSKSGSGSGNREERSSASNNGNNRSSSDPKIFCSFIPRKLKAKNTPPNLLIDDRSSFSAAATSQASTVRMGSSYSKKIARKTGASGSGDRNRNGLLPNQEIAWQMNSKSNKKLSSLSSCPQSFVRHRNRNRHYKFTSSRDVNMNMNANRNGNIDTVDTAPCTPERSPISNSRNDTSSKRHNNESARLSMNEVLNDIRASENESKTLGIQTYHASIQVQRPMQRSMQMQPQDEGQQQQNPQNQHQHQQRNLEKMNFLTQIAMKSAPLNRMTVEPPLWNPNHNHEDPILENEDYTGKLNQSQGPDRGLFDIEDIEDDGEDSSDSYAGLEHGRELIYESSSDTVETEESSRIEI